jgi:GH25 family lysozyme M1 (1,4-beta-N-acetylmuramidase)
MITHPQDDWAGAGIAKHEHGAQPQSAPAAAAAVAGVPGMDVSGHQGAVNWQGSSGAGAKFVYIKATESTNYINPDFAQQYNGSYGVGMVRGAYHFATPNTATGSAQATWFLAHGGGWSADGRTLPPAVDLEYNPYGQTCYSMSPAALVAWVRQFVNTVRTKVGRYPTIYTSTSWWSQCMGSNASFGADPLWIARYNSTLGALPPGWHSQAIWQYADSGRFPGDQDAFNGSLAQLQALAKG